jgi:hypothetical protein
MLRPEQFEVNETWIAFRINNDPIQTESDGDFNGIVLMDAASCFLLSSTMIPADAAEPTRAEFRRLLEDAKQHKQQLPVTLFIPRENVAELATLEAQEQGIEVVRVPERELMVFIGEARAAFAERFEGSQE